MRDLAEFAALPGMAPTVLTDEPQTRVEIRSTAHGDVVVKTYRNLGLRWWQTFARPSRAAREFQNLTAIAAMGICCTEPLAWHEVRRGKFVDASTLVTKLLSPARSLKECLATALPAEPRSNLAAAMGALLRKLHLGGVLWSTPMPRNVLVLGDPQAHQLAVCDVPNAIAFGHSLLGCPVARIDLFRANFSNSRRRDWTARERWRFTLAYADGDAELGRALWRDLARRTTMGTDLRRSLSAVRNVYFASNR